MQGDGPALIKVKFKYNFSVPRTLVLFGSVIKVVFRICDMLDQILPQNSFSLSASTPTASEKHPILFSDHFRWQV